MNITDKLNNKKILIWGYGREGKSTEKFIQKFCNVEKLKIYEGSFDSIMFNSYDYIIKSPGIVLSESDTRITSQTDLFMEKYRNQIIGITGTKGKSTTSALLYHVLKECTNFQIVLLGNIGVPCLDFYYKINKDTIIVFEMSCHQLVHASISPHIAVFLNLYEDHLDYYNNLENYFNAKCNIAKYQTKDDVLYVGDNVPKVNTRSNKIVVKANKVRYYQLKLFGNHNQYNADIVYQIATQQYNCDPDDVKKCMESFSGLPHRQEYVGTIDGISYYDDSISTTCHSTINSVLSIPNVGSVLVGGMDRMINYSDLIEFIRRNDRIHFICMYDSGKRIYEEVKDLANCHYFNDIYDGVAYAKGITQNGKACILSPAAASYGYFKNFEERGDEFQKIVKY